MGHTQLKTRMQGGHVEHRGEIEVKVVQKEKSGGEEGRQKTKKAGEKKTKQNKKKQCGPSRKSTVQFNQEDSESRPLNHMYLKKGSIWSQEVDL